MQGKFKFCFWELSVIFSQNIFNLRLVKSINGEPVDKKA